MSTGLNAGVSTGVNEQNEQEYYHLVMIKDDGTEKVGMIQTIVGAEASKKIIKGFHSDNKIGFEDIDGALFLIKEKVILQITLNQLTQSEYEDYCTQQKINEDEQKKVMKEYRDNARDNARKTK